MPGNEWPFASFLMLTWGFCSSVLVSLLLWPCGQMASCVPSGAHSPGWRATLWPWTICGSNDYKFRWYLYLNGMPLELVYYGYLQLAYWTDSLHSLFWSEVSHLSILLKYWYNTSFQLQAHYQGSYKSRELLRLTYCSVWQFTSEAWPAQFSHFPHGIKYLTSIWWALESILLWPLPQVLAWGESVGTLSGRWDDFYVHPSYLVGIEPFMFWRFSLVWYLCAREFIVLHARLCQSHELQYCVERYRPNHASPRIISTLQPTTAVSLLYLSYKLAKVYCFITSLIHLEPGLCHNKPLHRAYQKERRIHLSRICERLFVGLSLLIRFLDLWFVEWFSWSHKQKWSGHNHLFLGKRA